MRKAVRDLESTVEGRMQRGHSLSACGFCLLASCFWVVTPTRAQNADHTPRSAPPPAAVSKVELLVLLSSKMETGTPFKANVAQAGTGLRKGSVVTGHIITHKAGWFHRAGYLGLVFDGTENPPRNSSTDLTHTEGTDHPSDSGKVNILDIPGHRIDSEGMIHARKSKKRVLLEVGSAILVGKVADDTTDGLLLLLGGTPNGWPSRIVALAAGGIVWAVEKGANVSLKPGTVISVSVEQGKVNVVAEAGYH